MRTMLHVVGLGLLLLGGMLALAYPALPALVLAAVGLGLALATHRYGEHGPEVR